MEYKDIIKENCLKHCKVNNWWPKFAYHYTDIRNAISILSSGYLYSRVDAAERGVMSNDNASRQVIDMTNPDVTSKVRFYFRPLTPTQYYNEGFKHPALRYDQDINANVPVPIFLLFDLEKLLSVQGVQFSETSQAGKGSALQSGIEAFSKLNFDYIYDNEFENFSETKIYRHAEIVHPNSLSIEPYLERVLCRNDLEKTTLLNLLKKENQLAFNKYKNKIGVYKKDIFEYNGLFVTECSYHENLISIEFTDSYNFRHYTERMMRKYELSSLDPITVNVWISWKNSKTVLCRRLVSSKINLLSPSRLTIKVPQIANAKEITVNVLFDDQLMCYIEQPLETAEVIK